MAEKAEATEMAETTEATEAACTVKDAHGRNCTTLARRHPMPFDADIAFSEETHTYHYKGERVPISVTKLVKRLFPDTFDPDATIEAYLPNWRRNPNHKLHDVVAGLDDEAAAIAVKDKWLEANLLGTQLHRELEQLLNEEPNDADPRIAHEFEAGKRFWESHGMRAIRTELSIPYLRADGSIAAAGQADALCEFVADDGTKELLLLDWKRTEGDLDSYYSHGKYGVGTCEGIPDCKRTQYSLQLALYAAMLEQHGVHVKRSFLVKLHANIVSFELTPTDDFMEHARALLQSL